MNSFIQALKALLFPPSCLVCDTRLHHLHDTLLCQTCQKDIQPLTPPWCPRCGLPFSDRIGPDHLCGSCLQSPPPFTSCRSFLSYSDTTAHLIHSLKYGKKMSSLPFFAELWMKHDFGQYLPDCDIILPVPLHKKRLQWRGFNQSLVLANLLFEQRTNRIAPRVLIRNRNTPPQTSLNKKQRLRNLKGAFQLNTQSSVTGKKVLLFDDVFTTGTTLNECAKLLLQNGALAVHACTLARVIR